jgi:tetratricopeptide (TPR) repeat protein
MFYHLRRPYSQNLKQVVESLELTGDKALYTMFVPASKIVTYQFEKEKITKEEARDVIERLKSLYEVNQNDEKYGQYYAQGWEYAKSVYAPFENSIFDCNYFIEEYKPLYYADPDNPELMMKIIAKLKAVDCPADDPFFMEVDAKWKVYAEAENARLQAEFEERNPNVAAKRLYDEGKYDEAITKYDEAIEQAEDDEKKASYLFSKASIQGRKLKQYTAARNTAYSAAKLKSDWGRPYMLIGDMYGMSARSCGDDWNQRLAILAAIDKYNYAKSIDPEVAEEATKKIGQYYSSKPDKSEGHMRGVKAGAREKVGCWIGEEVRVSFK